MHATGISSEGGEDGLVAQGEKERGRSDAPKVHRVSVQCAPSSMQYNVKGLRLWWQREAALRFDFNRMYVCNATALQEATSHLKSRFRMGVQFIMPSLSSAAAGRTDAQS